MKEKLVYQSYIVAYTEEGYKGAFLDSEYPITSIVNLEELESESGVLRAHGGAFEGAEFVNIVNFKSLQETHNKATVPVYLFYYRTDNSPFVHKIEIESPNGINSADVILDVLEVIKEDGGVNPVIIDWVKLREEKAEET